MIKYKLICKNCNLLFDSWFASSNEYEKLKKNNYLNCYNCSSLKVEKTLMSPSLINSKKNFSNNLNAQKYINFKKTIRKYQKFIKNNFDYVGKNFAYEARALHYNDNKKKDKGIYGSASNEELKELKEEGIETNTILLVNDKEN
jgi:hypothetical protein